MKIIFVIPNLSSGGAERVISILADSFIEHGVDVDILLLKERKISYSISEKVNIVYLDMDLLSCSKITACKYMRKYFKKEKQKHKKIVVIPFLDVCLKRTLIASLGLNIPVIASERNDPNQKGTSFIKKIKSNIPYILATHCIFQTTGARNYYCRIVRNKSDIIMNPLSMASDIQWKGQKSRRIISVGRLEPQKNQMLLINAFSHIHKEFPDYKLEIYGEGSLRKQLQSRINELNLEDAVYLCGCSSDIYSIMENALLFVLSSDYEGLSNALIEALSTGMPVISTDHQCGGAGMLIKNGANGMLIPVNDEYAMFNAMKRIIEDEEFALSIAENARKIRKVLSVEKISNKWLDIIYGL